MGVGSFPSPVPVRGGPVPPQFEDFFSGPQLEPIPAQQGEEGFVPVTVQDLFLERQATGDTEGASAFMTGFQLWAINNGFTPDPNDAELSRFYIQSLFEEEEPAGGGGRTQFESERALDLATAALREEQAQTEAFQREALREQAASQAFERAKDKQDLLLATDQLADARREAATQALMDALPFLVSPDQQFTPGFEPFGVGPQLGNLLGANVPPRELPTAELPLQELANPPLAASPAGISAGLDPFLTAPGVPQI